MTDQATRDRAHLSAWQATQEFVESLITRIVEEGSDKRKACEMGALFLFLAGIGVRLTQLGAERISDQQVSDLIGQINRLIEVFANGWQPHNGGSFPYALQTLVKVQLRFESRDESQEARPAASYEWYHEDKSDDIIAFKVCQ